jgi:hypothetical protein
VGLPLNAAADVAVAVPLVSRRSRRARGSSLIEAMISASLLALGLTAVVSGLGQASGVVGNLRRGSVAGAVLRDLVEDDLLKPTRTTGSESYAFDGTGRLVSDRNRAVISVVVSRAFHPLVPGVLVVTGTATWDNGKRHLNIVTMRG